jgi:hypothetical protein
VRTKCSIGISHSPKKTDATPQLSEPISLRSTSCACDQRHPQSTRYHQTSRQRIDQLRRDPEDGGQPDPNNHPRTPRKGDDAMTTELAMSGLALAVAPARHAGTGKPGLRTPIAGPGPHPSELTSRSASSQSSSSTGLPTGSSRPGRPAPPDSPTAPPVSGSPTRSRHEGRESLAGWSNTDTTPRGG